MAVSLFACATAEASEFEVLKQKKCTLLVAPSTPFSSGETFKAETTSGSKLTLRVAKKRSKGDVLVVAGRSGRCARVRGPLFIQGAGVGPSAGKKFFFGIAANGGLYTFKQPFVPTEKPQADQPPPTDGAQSDGSSGQSNQVVNGLAGVGYGGGILLRYVPKFPFGLELGVSALSASLSGKTVIGNNDDYVVNAKFTEVIALPGFSFSKCIISRLYCRFAGLYGMPVSAKMSIKTTDTNLETTVKYQRLGADLAGGVNLGSVVTIVAGGQISVIKGSFQFTPEDPAAQIQNTLTVYIYGGITTAF